MTTVSRMTHGPTNQRDYLGTRYCRRCNAVYQSSFSTEDNLCPNCRKAEEKAERESRPHTGDRNSYKPFIVVNGCGDFEAGRVFDSFDFIVSLDAGVWPVGMTVRRGSILYTVIEPRTYPHGWTGRIVTCYRIRDESGHVLRANINGKLYDD